MIGSGKHWRVTVEPNHWNGTRPTYVVRRREWNGWPLRSTWDTHAAAMAEADRLARMGHRQRDQGLAR